MSADTLQAYVALGGLILAMVGLPILVLQIRALQRSVRSGAHAAMYAQAADVRAHRRDGGQLRAGQPSRPPAIRRSRTGRVARPLWSRDRFAIVAASAAGAARFASAGPIEHSPVPGRPIASTPDRSIPLTTRSGRRCGPPIRIFFFGGARAVTGSMYVIEAAGRRILFECGLFQGRRREAEERNRYLPFDPRGIDAMVLSHAHIDHSGNIPSLVAQGFRGPIYATHATRDLCAVMLRDSGRIHERDAEWYNRKVRRRGEPLAQPLYSEEDAIDSLRHFVGIDYGAPLSLGPGLRFELRDAGHVLGSGMVVLDHENGRRTRLCFTGDLGRRSMPLLRDPSPVEDVNVLIMESTYGDRSHPAVSSMRTTLAEVVNRTVARGGKILIPAFALERAQTVVYLLHRLLLERAIPPVPIYVDSPMTADITAVFKLHPEHFDAEARSFWERADPFGFGPLRYVADVEESKALNYLQGPAIIISASGMCEAGRIVHHLRNNVEDERNTILIVGFQARNTLGRQLVEHRSEVRIFGIDVPVEAEVVDVGAFSSHADGNELAAFAGTCKRTIGDVFLVHGEEPQAQALANRLRAAGIPRVTVPQAGAFHDVNTADMDGRRATA